MGLCSNCGNDYDECVEVTLGGRSYTFDSFECAIHLLAPACVHCAETDGVAGLRDRL